MDAQLIHSLTAALAASPENIALRLSVIRLHLDADRVDELNSLLAPLAAEDLDRAEDRLLAGRASIAADLPETALAFLTDDSAEARLERARALLELGREEEGQTEYQAAVRANPALEDPDLGAQLKAFKPAMADDRPKLRVISNDDTMAEDLHRALMPEQERVTFANVRGLEKVKEEIRRKIILPYLKPSLFQKFRKRIGGGILLYGPPGCGKTLLARATAGECNAKFFNVMISDILDMYIGESERKLHGIFESARQQAPAVLFFDEIEAVGAKRQYSHEGTSAKVVSQFLSEMDGFNQDNQGVLVLGATNVPWALDPAFRRPGRFDRTFFVPPPDREARAAILGLELEERPVVPGIDLDVIAKSTSGYSGADLKNIVETASDIAIERSIDSGHEVPIEAEFLKDALQDSAATTLEWLTTARNYARYANDGGQYNAVLEFLRKHGKM